MKNLVSTINSIKNGTFGVELVTLTPMAMNKRNNPYYGKVFNVAVYKNAAMGVNYYALVKGECAREGIVFSDDEFKAVFPYEPTYCSNEGKSPIFTHNKSGQQYLRVYKGRRPTKVERTMVIELPNGLTEVKVGSPLYKEIMSFSQKKDEKKQEALGIKNIIEVRNIKLENVLKIKQGGKEYVSDRLNTIKHLL